MNKMGSQDRSFETGEKIKCVNHIPWMDFRVMRKILRMAD